MSNARRVLIWALPLAALLIGLAVYALWPAAPEDHERPAPLVHETVEPEKPDLPVPDAGRDVRPTPEPETVSGGLRGRLITPDFKPVKGQGRVEAVRGSNLGEPGLGTAERLGISSPLDGEGRFSLSRLPAIDGVVLQLQGETFAPGEAGPFLVDAGATRDVGDLMVQRGTDVVVSVLDPRGKPVPGATVGLYQTAFEPGFDEPPYTETVTDESGIARFPHARSALFSVRARAEGFALAQLQAGPVYGEAPTEFQVVINLVEPQPIVGRVLSDPEGQPIAGAQVDAVPIDAGNGGGRATTDADGRFSIADIAPGNYTVAARAKGFSARSERVGAGKGPVQVELRLKKQGLVRGTVVGDDGAPVTAFQLQPRSHKRRLDPAFPRMSLMHVVNEQGEFVLEGLDPGFWCVEAWAQGYALTESPCVRVRQGQEVVGFVVKLARGATLKGLAVDASGAPVAGARVSLHPNFEPEAEALRDTEATAAGGEGRTDEQGRFELRDLAARAFQLQLDHPDFAILRRNDVVSQAGKEVDLGAIVLTRSGSVSGQALSSLGDPLSGVTVHLYRVGDWTRQTTSDGQGEFRFERLPEGDYELSCYGRNPNFGAMLAALDGPDKPVPFRVGSGQHVQHDVVALE